MACTYCFYLSKADLFSTTPRHRMSPDLLEEMIRQAMEQGDRFLSFGWQGGEPTLLGLDFFERAVELQKKYGQGKVVGNGLQTNGLLIDSKWSRFLREYRFLVGLSLDGPEYIHNRYRTDSGGKGTWNKVVDAAKRMLDEGVAVNALVVVNDYSVQFPEEIYTFHKELGLRYMQFIPCVEFLPEERAKPARFTVPAEKYGEFLIRLFDLWRSDFSGYRATTSIRWFDALIYSYVGLEPPDCTLQQECGTYLVVEHNGDVFACDFFVETSWRLGNILEGRLGEFLNSKQQWEFGRRKTRLPQECIGCSWLRYCWGGCPKDRMVLPDGTRKNYLCEAYKMFFRHAHRELQQIARVVEWQVGQEMATGGAEASQKNRPHRQVGRNDPCPCGSGRKYKFCHGYGKL